MVGHVAVLSAQAIGVDPAGGTTHRCLSECRVDTRWHRLGGGIRVRICVLMDIGWDPVQPDQWDTYTGSSHAIPSEPAAEAALFLRLCLDMSCVAWKQAVCRRGGTRAGRGVYLAQSTRKLRVLERRGEHLQAGVLRTSAIAGPWLSARLCQADFSADDSCSFMLATWPSSISSGTGSAR